MVLVVHAANFGIRPKGAFQNNVERKLTNGLIRNGHQVVGFSDRDAAMAGSLLGPHRVLEIIEVVGPSGMLADGAIVAQVADELVVGADDGQASIKLGNDQLVPVGCKRARAVQERLPTTRRNEPSSP